MSDWMPASRKPILIGIILLLFGGTAYAGWNYYNSPPAWVTQTNQEIVNSTAQDEMITAKAKAESAHRRMALEKARLKAISNLMQSMKKAGGGVTIDKSSTDSGLVTTKTFSGSMNDFVELDTYVEKAPNGDYRAYYMIGFPQ
jgi:hypothetical protein